MAKLHISVNDPARLEVRATVVKLQVQVGGSGAGKELHNILKVDATYGSDTRAAADHNFPFRSITAAKNAAAVGDTIVVYPGRYDEYNLARNGLSMHFLPGAIVEYNGSVAGACIFSDNNTAMDFHVSGKGQFNNLGTGGSNDCIKTQNAATHFFIECDTLYAETNRAVSNYAGLVEITARHIEANDGTIDSINYDAATGTTRVKASTIKSLNNYVLEFDGGLVEVDADEIIAENASFAAITTSSGSGSIRVKAKRVIASGYGVEALGLGLVYLEGINFQCGDGAIAEGRTGVVFVDGCTEGTSFTELTASEYFEYITQSKFASLEEALAGVENSKPIAPNVFVPAVQAIVAENAPATPFASNDETAAGTASDKAVSPAGQSFSQDIENYRYRAIMDQVTSTFVTGNSIRSEATMAAIFKFYKETGYYPDIQLILAAELGIRYAASGVNNVVSKAYSIGRRMSDAYQSTAVNQPYLSRYIASNEKYAFRNVPGGTRYFGHSNVDFSASEAWTITFVINWDGSTNTLAYATGLGSGTFVRLRNVANKFALEAVNYPSGYSSVQFLSTNNHTIGKASIIHYVYDGAGNLSLYINGIFIETIAWTLPVRFNSILTSASQFHGDYYLHVIRKGASTQQQITNEAAFIRTVFQEIPSVTIGTQTWATSNLQTVCTPQGNVIPEVQNSSYTEKITVAADRDFSSDTGFYLKSTGCSIADGVAHFFNTVGGGGVYKNSFLTIGRWYKVTYQIVNYVTGNHIISNNGYSGATTKTGNGTFTETFKAAGTQLGILTTIAINQFDIESLSCQELGWANATEIYDIVYAATAGDAATKEYAAVKEAAMWSQYLNDQAYGTIYGKLFNWYAARLLELDIAAYNAANPNAKYGWHLPTQAEWLSLQANQGGESTAGAGLKLAETTYWLTPNTGATNQSGFTALPAGRRNYDGSFAVLTGNFYAWAVTASGSNAYTAELLYNATTMLVSARSKLEGAAIRLIKD